MRTCTSHAHTHVHVCTCAKKATFVNVVVRLLATPDLPRHLRGEGRKKKERTEGGKEGRKEGRKGRTEGKKVVQGRNKGRNKKTEWKEHHYYHCK